MRHLLNYKKLLFSCLIYSSMWVGMMFIVKNQSTFNLSGNDNLWTNFFGISGIIYAITAAFLLLIVLQKFDNFKNLTHHEINIGRDIRDLLIFIKTDQELQIKAYQSLINHFNETAHGSFNTLRDKKRRSEYSSDTCENIYNLMRYITMMEPKSQSGKIALEKIISKITDLTSVRSNRIMLSCQSLSPLLYFFLWFMSVMLNIPFILFDGENVAVQGLMVAAIASSLRILNTIIKDFDDPLNGFWNTDLSELIEFIEKEKNKDLKKLYFYEFVIR